jgi:superfamily II DNA or RNA helicase
MLRLQGDTLRWGEEDRRAMTKILGADNAVKLRAPYNPSIIKLADRKQVELSMKLKKKLDSEILYREQLEPLKKFTDFTPQSPLEKRYFKHQRADLAYIRNTQFSAYLLAHDPGVGKTLLAIRWAALLGAKRILTITPNSAKEQWYDAWINWWLMPDMVERMPEPTIVDGSTADQVLKAQKNGIVIGHWESLVHARIGYMQKPWDLVIADEAHNAQNRKAQRTETLHDLDAKYRMALTAHPYTNSPDDFFAILKFLYPNRYSSFWRYWEMHVDYDPKPFGGYSVNGARRPHLLAWEIAPFTLRRTKKSLGWTPPSILKRHVDLTRKGRREYDRMRKEFFIEIAGREKQLCIPSDLARVTRMRQYLIDPGILGGTEPSPKYPVVFEILRELTGPPVIFTEFKQAAYRLDQFLRKHGKIKRLAHINGDVHGADRDANRKWFVQGKLDALIVVTKAGGEALNLGGHGYTIVLDLPWTPRGWEQLLGRVDRPTEGTGKIVPVTAFPILVRDSYETKKMKLELERKHKDFSKVFVSDVKELFA